MLLYRSTPSVDRLVPRTRPLTLAIALAAAACGGHHGGGVSGETDPAVACESSKSKNDKQCVGQVRATVRFNQCPDVQITLFPNEVATGASIALETHLSDADRDKLTVHWSSDHGGKFSPNAKAPDTFVCTKPGPATLTISVDDGRGCLMEDAVTVSCTDAP